MRTWPFVVRGMRVGLLTALGLLVLQALQAPDQRDALRSADALLAQRRYHEALESYRLLDPIWPDGSVALRLGLMRSIRGEARLAEDALRPAVRRGLRPPDREIAFLYLGLQHQRQGRPRYAANAWAQVPPTSPRYGLRLALEAEQALTAEDYALAETLLRQANATALPGDWGSLVAYRLALLLAARDPVAAQVMLTTAPAAPPDLLLASLLPLSPAQIADASRSLSAALQAAPAAHSQLLARCYLDARLYRLAESELATESSSSANTSAASALAAFARWQAGDHQGGLSRLQTLVARNPGDTRARSMLAVAYLGLDRPQDASRQLNAINASAAGDPLTFLAWGQWYVAERDYPQAVVQYRRAVNAAVPAERADYALAAAQFHFSTGYGVCEEGRAFATSATTLASTRPEAWEMLASISYHCGSTSAARDAATSALALAPESAVASYYLGAALAALGDSDAARTALVRAADLDPAGIWRQRAEQQLDAL